MNAAALVAGFFLLFMALGYTDKWFGFPLALIGGALAFWSIPL